MPFARRGKKERREKRGSRHALSPPRGEEKGCRVEGVLRLHMAKSCLPNTSQRKGGEGEKGEKEEHSADSAHPFARLVLRLLLYSLRGGKEGGKRGEKGEGPLRDGWHDIQQMDIHIDFSLEKKEREGKKK